MPTPWVGLEELPVGLATTFTIQYQDDLWFFTFGTLVPPLLLGSEEQRAAQIDQLEFVPIRPLARIGMTAARAREVYEVLGGLLESYGSEEQPKEA